MNGTTHCRIPEQADSHAGIPIYELFRAVSLPSASSQSDVTRWRHRRHRAISFPHSMTLLTLHRLNGAQRGPGSLPPSSTVRSNFYCRLLSLQILFPEKLVKILFLPRIFLFLRLFYVIFTYVSYFSCISVIKNLRGKGMINVSRFVLEKVSAGLENSQKVMRRG